MSNEGLLCWNCGEPTGIRDKVSRADACVKMYGGFKMLSRLSSFRTDPTVSMQGAHRNQHSQQRKIQFL